MKILVNGREAVLKANASFEYVSENPLFTEAEDYTMEIVFPMKDCPQNILIFGPLHVDGVDIPKVSFPCEMQDGGHFSKSGILTITSVSDTEVKGQFLEGMSQQNFASDLDTILTDLDFSQWDGSKQDFENYTPGPDFGWDDIWVWDSKRGETVHGATGVGDYHKIYLSHLIKLIGKATGWSINYDALMAIPMFKYILVVNTRREHLSDDYIIRPLNSYLPRWTVKQFLDELSMFFGCIYRISSTERQITFQAHQTIYTQHNVASIVPIDDFSVEVLENDSSYRGNKGVRLPNECNEGRLNSCRGIETDARIPHYSLTYEELVNTILYGAANPLGKVHTYLGEPVTNDFTERVEGWKGLKDKYLYYITDRNLWAVLTKTDEQYIYPDTADEETPPDYRFQVAEIINQFDMDENGTELKICPCSSFKYTYHPVYPVLPFVPIPEDHVEDVKLGGQKPALEYVAEGLRDEALFYYDKLWVILYKENESGKKIPFVRKYEPNYIGVIVDDENGNYVVDENSTVRGGKAMNGFVENPYTLAPSDPSIQNVAALPKVDETKLYRYKWLTKTLPSPTSIFLINSKRFACLRITALFTVNGMSELVEGEFYEIID